MPDNHNTSNAMRIYKPWAACALLAGLFMASGHAADPGVTDKEIVVGQFAAQTGPAAELGKRMQLGMLAHFNAVNAAGGVNGRSIKLVSRDDGYEPDKAAAAVKALIEEDKVFALVGSVSTPTTLAAELGDTGAGVTISQVVPFPYTPSSAIVREYQQRMTDAGNKDFDFSSMEGFLAAKVFVEGVRRAGKTLTRESLVTGLESMRDFNLGGFIVNYSPKSHEGSRYTDLTIIGRGGRFVR